MRISPHPCCNGVSLTASVPGSVFQQILWLLKKAGKSFKDYTAYCIDNPGGTGGDIWDWIKRNKLTCFLIASGTLVIVVPLAIGFGPAGPIAGRLLPTWKSYHTKRI